MHVDVIAIVIGYATMLLGAGSLLTWLYYLLLRRIFHVSHQKVKRVKPPSGRGRIIDCGSEWGGEDEGRP